MLLAPKNTALAALASAAVKLARIAGVQYSVWDPKMRLRTARTPTAPRSRSTSATYETSMLCCSTKRTSG
jgi:hypothetical protein